MPYMNAKCLSIVEFNKNMYGVSVPTTAITEPWRTGTRIPNSSPSQGSLSVIERTAYYRALINFNSQIWSTPHSGVLIASM